MEGIDKCSRSHSSAAKTSNICYNYLFREGGAFIKARCLFEQLLGGYGKFFWSFIILYLHRAKMLARMVCGKEVPNGANIKEGLGWGGQNLFD